MREDTAFARASADLTSIATGTADRPGSVITQSDLTSEWETRRLLKDGILRTNARLIRDTTSGTMDRTELTEDVMNGTINVRSNA